MILFIQMHFSFSLKYHVVRFYVAGCVCMCACDGRWGHCCSGAGQNGVVGCLVGGGVCTFWLTLYIFVSTESPFQVSFSVCTLNYIAPKFMTTYNYYSG